MDTFTVGGALVAVDDESVQWESGLAVDADGCPRAYALAGARGSDGEELHGLDLLRNAGRPAEYDASGKLVRPAKWYGVVTDDGKKTGNPIVQGPSDPAPGYCVSPTALQDHSRKASDPLRYVDADAVPYLAVPPNVLWHDGLRLVEVGDVAVVCYRDRMSAAIVADVGPADKIGEGSMELARRLGMDPSPRHGGAGGGVSVKVFRASSRGWPRTVESIEEQLRQLMAPQVVTARS